MKSKNNMDKPQNYYVEQNKLTTKEYSPSVLNIWLALAYQNFKSSATCQIMIYVKGRMQKC